MREGKTLFIKKAKNKKNDGCNFQPLYHRMVSLSHPLSIEEQAILAFSHYVHVYVHITNYKLERHKSLAINAELIEIRKAFILHMKR